VAPGLTHLLIYHVSREYSKLAVVDATRGFDFAYHVKQPVRTLGLLALFRFVGWSVELDAVSDGLSGSVDGDGSLTSLVFDMTKCVDGIL
jgi:hypothetical protein